jgi:acetate---CoA ligase (ADP-forming)
VHELDGDLSYPLALQDAAALTGKPVAVLSNLSSAIDQEVAGQLRAGGIPVLEGTRSGLLALRHLIGHGARAAADTAGACAAIDIARQRRGRALLAAGEVPGGALLGLLAEYGMTVARSVPVSSPAAALRAAAEIGYPVVLKTDEPAIAHKSDVGGVLLGIADAGQLAAAYADLAARLGPRALVCESVPPGVELALGLARDPELGLLLVTGAGGVLVELLADRAVALPPVPANLARELVAGLRVRRLLDGARGGAPADMDAVVAAITGLSQLAAELGDELEALDVNPLICGPAGAVAVDALAIPRAPG